MATINNFITQEYVDLKNGMTVGIHVFKPLSTSDTFTVPELDNSSSPLAVRHLAKSGQTAVTLVTTDAYTVTINASAAQVAATDNEIVVVTLHKQGRKNFTPENASALF